MRAEFPVARWVALAWLGLWAPAYWMTWGPANFLLFCDVAVILTCAGIWWRSSLLLSSQALTLVFNAAWTLDLAWTAALGKGLFGGTEYMWDAQFPLWVRLLSFFHVLLPVAQIWALRRTGYDARGWKLQSAVTLGLMMVCTLMRPEKNLNYIYTEPIFGLSWGPMPVHILVVWAFIILVIYWPTHCVLKKLLSPRMNTDRHG